MKESRHLLQHFLAAIAYRTQKALRGAPDDFGNVGADQPLLAAPDSWCRADQPPLPPAPDPLRERS